MLRSAGAKVGERVPSWLCSDPACAPPPFRTLQYALVVTTPTVTEVPYDDDPVGAAIGIRKYLVTWDDGETESVVSSQELTPQILEILGEMRRPIVTPEQRRAAFQLVQ